MPSRIGESDMEQSKTSQEEWVSWLHERHIPRDIADAAGLKIQGEELAIPIRDISGHVVFYKHRRSFKTDAGPKYRYDIGASAALFGAENLKFLSSDEVLVITEGELDALAVRALGYKTVSSSGGAGTWKPEWNGILAGIDSPILLYDADRAGIVGALRVASILPHARIAWCPVEYGKDPTDVIISGHENDLLKAIGRAKRYQVPNAGDTNRLEALKSLRDVWLLERGELLQDREATPFHIDICLTWVEEEIYAETRLRKMTERRPSVEFSNDLERARAHPIPKLIKISRSGFAKCVHHREKSASMKYYPGDNHCYSFCCNKKSDAIDIYQALNNCDLKTAIAALV